MHPGVQGYQYIAATVGDFIRTDEATEIVLAA
jgi:hypothetical protein